MTGHSLLHFEVLQEIGRGGMGVVYLARDSRLGRTVALKVLSQAQSSDAKRKQRFLREARAAAALNHPNIVSLYEIGTDRDTDFIAMEFVAGETLYSRIQRGRLPIADIVSYAWQMAGALAKAHAAGVVHRDLKPGNAMITPEGQLKLLDFGLAQLGARSPSSSGSETTESLSNLSELGAVQGTVAYMSPEQARGDAIDLRSDIFSFGVLLYEMLTGNRPFHGGNTMSVLHAIVFQQPAPVEKLRDDAPPILSEIVRKCLQKDCDQRHQTMEPILAELRTLAGNTTATSVTAAAPSPKTRGPWLYGLSAASLALLISIGVWAYFHQASIPAEADAPELVRKGYAYLARYDKADNKDRAIRSFQKALQQDNTNAAAYAGLADSYALQHASNPDDQLLRQARSNAKRALELNPLLAAAHESLGNVLIEERRLQDGERELRRSLELDPNHVDAQINLGDCLTHQNRVKEAEEVYRKLIATHPAEWRGYVFLGSLLIHNGRDAEAVDALQKAGTLVQDNVTVFRLLGLSYQRLGRDTEAAAAYQKALAVRPTASIYGSLGALYFYMGRYHDAMTAFQGAVSLSANEPMNWANLAAASRHAAGNEGKAKQAYEQAIRLVENQLSKNPDNGEMRSRLILYLAESGESERARAELRKLGDSGSLDHQSLFSLGVASEFMGDRTAALRYLGQAVKAGYSTSNMNADPDLMALRRDPRYHLQVLAQARASTKEE